MIVATLRQFNTQGSGPELHTYNHTNTIVTAQAPAFAGLSRYSIRFIFFDQSTLLRGSHIMLTLTSQTVCPSRTYSYI